MESTQQEEDGVESAVHQEHLRLDEALASAESAVQLVKDKVCDDGWIDGLMGHAYTKR